MQSLFKRPPWAVQTQEDATPDFYRRSQHTYTDIIAANRDTRVKNPRHTNTIESQDNKTIKRCRVSKENSSSQCHSPPLSITYDTPQRQDICFKPQCPVSEPPQISTLSLPQSKALGTGDSLPSAHILSSTTPSNGDIVHGIATHKTKKFSESGHDLFLGSSTDQNSCAPNQSGLKQEFEHVQQDGTVQVLVTSEIPETKPLIVHRKISQSFREVRLAWCKRQNLTGLEKSVFLTWKGRRIFDVTTSRSLGIKTPAAEDVIGDAGNFRIHVEAVAEDSIPSQANSGISAPNISPTSKSHCQSSQTSDIIRITLKCLDSGHYKIKASSKASISRIISSFREAKHLAQDQQVHLFFDGDRLDPGSRLGDYDIADLDMIDVCLK